MIISRRHLLAVGSAAFGAASLPLLARAEDTWDNGFAAFMHDGLAKSKTPGMAVAIVRQGKTVLARGYGLADIAANRPVTADTAFHIASCSKTVTGTALMMLFEQGKFALDGPIAPHLDFAVAHPAFPAKAITFRMLMTHTSGIADKVYYDVPAFSSAGDSPIALRDFLIGYLTPQGQWYKADGCYGAEPGTAWDYSNVGIALLGYLAGRLGSELGALTHERLFTTLCMMHTSWTYTGLPPESIATPYDCSGDVPKALPPTGYPDWPAGLLRTTANDFARFLAVYTQDGTLDGHAYLATATIATMLTPGAIPAGPGVDQALVWELRKLGDYRLAVHPGGDPGASTVVAVDLDRKTAVLAFANASGNGDFRAFQKEVVSRLLQKAAE